MNSISLASLLIPPQKEMGRANRFLLPRDEDQGQDEDQGEGRSHAMDMNSDRRKADTEIDAGADSGSESKIIQLQSLLREKFPGAHGQGRGEGAGAEVEEYRRFATGVPGLDALGLVKGNVTEIVSHRSSSGGALAIHALIGAAAAESRYVALVDGNDSFDPQSAGAEACRRLLWLRCRKVEDAIKATDLLLRDGNLPLVILDLQLCALRQLGGVHSSVWFRLRSLAEQTNAVLLAFTPAKLITSAHLRAELDRSFDLGMLDLPREDLVERLQLSVTRQQRHQLFIDRQQATA